MSEDILDLITEKFKLLGVGEPSSSTIKRHKELLENKERKIIKIKESDNCYILYFDNYNKIFLKKSWNLKLYFAKLSLSAEARDKIDYKFSRSLAEEIRSTKQ